MITPRALHLAVFAILFVSCLATPGAAQPVYTDAEVLAYEWTGLILGPPSVVAVIGADLAAIRSAHPTMQDIHVLPVGVPGEVMVRLTEEARARFDAGEPTAFADLNDAYGATELQVPPLGAWIMVTFYRPYNPEALASEYAALDDVVYATPNYLSDGPDIVCEELHRYRFYLRWGDCLSGCIWEFWWDFAVNGGVVELLETDGDQPGGIAASPSDGAAVPVLAQNTPNPFNPVTVISFEVPTTSHVRLTVHDLAGRHVATLLDAERPAGPGRASWNGRDGRGRLVAGGIYLYRLETAGVTLARRMLLLN
jgi:hypothetical protein